MMRRNGLSERYLAAPPPPICDGCNVRANCLHSLPNGEGRRVCRECYAAITGNASPIVSAGSLAGVAVGDGLTLWKARAGAYIGTQQAEQIVEMRVIEAKAEEVVTDNGMRFRRVDGTKIGREKGAKCVYYARKVEG